MRLRPFSLAALSVLLLAVPTSTSTQVAASTADRLTASGPARPSAWVLDPADGHAMGTSTTAPGGPVAPRATSSQTIDLRAWQEPSETRLGGRGAIALTEEPAVGIALSGRRLATVDVSAGDYSVGDRSLGTSGPFTAGPRRTLAGGPFLEDCDGPCVPLKAAGGATVYSGVSEFIVVDARGRIRRIPTPSQQDSFSTEIRLSDSYFGYYSTGFAMGSRLFDLSTGQSIAAPITPWTLWGDELWVVRLDFGTTGVVTRTNLKTGATASVTTPGRCHHSTVNLQVVGRWLGWRCTVVSQDVMDMTTGRRISLNAAWPGVLGDGYLVYRHDDGGLLRVNLTSGVPDTVRLAELEVGVGLLPYHGVRWAVDSYGGQCIAWSDSLNRVHLQPAGIPAATPLTLLTADVPRLLGRVWQPTWTLSKPANWALALRSDGVAVGSLSGSSYGTAVTPDWTGPETLSRTEMGPIRQTRVYDWELTLTPADGIGAPLVLKGRVVQGADRLPPIRTPGR